MMNKRLDRIHEFHLGQSMGFMLKAKVILKDADDFNPGLAVKLLRDELVVIREDMDRYAKLNRVEQLEIDDARLYDAEVQRADDILRRIES